MLLRNALWCLIWFAVMLVGCSSSNEHQAQGYVEGRYTYMATSVSGVLNAIYVSRGQSVQKGQLLFVLEPQPEIDAYQSAVENLKESVNARDAIAANLVYAKLTYERYKVLVPKNAIQQSELDSAKATYDATTAQLAQANATIASTMAALAQARWTKDQKMIYAPVGAVVFDTYYRIGEYTEANQAILSLLAPGDIKAIFYVNGLDLKRLKLNEPVGVSCSNCPKTYIGRVSFISPSAEYTPPVIYSRETSEKLVYRIEAEFNPKDAFHLHPGQPITVTYRLHE